MPALRASTVCELMSKTPRGNAADSRVAAAGVNQEGSNPADRQGADQRKRTSPITRSGSPSMTNRRGLFLPPRGSRSGGAAAPARVLPRLSRTGCGGPDPSCSADSSTERPCFVTSGVFKSTMPQNKRFARVLSRFSPGHTEIHAATERGRDGPQYQ